MSSHKVEIDSWLQDLMEDVAYNIMRQKVSDEEYFHYGLSSKPDTFDLTFSFMHRTKYNRVEVSLSEVLAFMMKKES